MNDLIPALVPVNPKKKHAFASPSKLEKILLCPYLAHNCWGWEAPDNEYSLRGDAMHEAMYSDERLKALAPADQEIVLAMRRKFIEPLGDMESHHEIELKLFDADGNEATFGTIDFLSFNNAGSARVIDWKFGSFPVPLARDNWQLKAYVVMVFQNYPQVERVYAMVAQPSEEIDYDNMCKFSREEMPAMRDEIVKIVEMAKAASASDANPLPDACRFCNKSACKTYQEQMGRALESYNASLTEAAYDLPALPAQELVCWCDEKYGQLELLENWVKEKKNQVKAPIQANGGSEHYRLTKATVRKVTDYKAMIAGEGISEETVAKYTTEKISEPYVTRRTRRGK